MNSEKNSHPQGDPSLLDHAEKLIWSLFDDQIKEEDLKRLEELITENEQVRLRYLQCAQIHADLYAHYQTGPVEPPNVQSPVLGSLLNDLSASHGGSTSLAD